MSIPIALEEDLFSPRDYLETLPGITQRSFEQVSFQAT
jgi:hypothetical protein